MRIGYISDTHYEFFNNVLHIIEDVDRLCAGVNIDLMVLAGDISSCKTVHVVANQFREVLRCPVIFVPGNHDYYGNTIHGAHLFWENTFAQNENIHYLNNSTIDINGMRIGGTPLWTDFHNSPMAWDIASRISDFRYIREFDWQQSASIFKEASEWIRNTEMDLLVTHFPVGDKANPKHFRGGYLSPYFTPEMTDISVPLMISGHTHHRTQYQYNETQVHLNCAGYPSELQTSKIEVLTCK